jgi:hypothetical protein
VCQPHPEGYHLSVFPQGRGLACCPPRDSSPRPVRCSHRRWLEVPESLVFRSTLVSSWSSLCCNMSVTSTLPCFVVIFVACSSPPGTTRESPVHNAVCPWRPAVTVSCSFCDKANTKSVVLYVCLYSMCYYPYVYTGVCPVRVTIRVSIHKKV